MLCLYIYIRLKWALFLLYTIQCTHFIFWSWHILSVFWRNRYTLDYKYSAIDGLNGKNIESNLIWQQNNALNCHFLQGYYHSLSTVFISKCGSFSYSHIMRKKNIFCYYQYWKVYSLFEKNKWEPERNYQKSFMNVMVD